MLRRVPLTRVIESRETPDDLRQRLMLAKQVRSFASTHLGLPDNNSYKDYVDLGRPYVVWNVVVAPQLSLSPQRWCFPVAGCISYRGYYSERDAREFANEWRNLDYDVSVGGVRAYSTLGWLDDPLLNSMLPGSGDSLAALIFHELAHQVVYIAGDTAFNEGFAVTVEREGLKRWWAYRIGKGDNPKLLADHTDTLARQAEFVELVSEARRDLIELYAAPGTDEDKREGKRARFKSLRDAYQQLRKRWDGNAGYDLWFARDLNNAKLALFATYHIKVSAFERLLRNHEGDLPSFYAEVVKLAEMSPKERDAMFEEIMTK